MRGKISGDFADSQKVAEWTRELIRPLVQHHERHSGSRMAAYKGVGDRIGVSSDWVQRVLARQRVIIHAHQWINLLSAYRLLCARIEADAEHKRCLAAQLRKDADATYQSSLGLDTGLHRTQEG